MGTSRKTGARQLREAVRRLLVAHGALKDARRPCGTQLPIPHAYALVELYQRDVPTTVSELAESLVIDRTNVSRLCARMEELGEVVRAPHPVDGRAKAVKLTARGKRLARSVDEQSAAHFERVMMRLNNPIGNIVRALEELSSAMNRTEEDDEYE